MILFVKLYILLIMFELNNFNVVIRGGHVLDKTYFLKDTALENKGRILFTITIMWKILSKLLWNIILLLISL